MEAVLITDDELAAEALAADPDAPVDAGAPSLRELGLAPAEGLLLPAWYMPAPAAGAVRRWWRWVALVVIAAFVALNAAGLCSTYGDLRLG